MEHCVFLVALNCTSRGVVSVHRVGRYDLEGRLVLVDEFAYRLVDDILLFVQGGLRPRNFLVLLVLF